jgi:Rrf2 family iron-sulfur cluster assembly transcriptional regulator
MPDFSRKLVYAIEAVLDIAYNSAGKPVQSSEISRRQNIPPRYLEPVLQQLVRQRVLTGVRGPRGGYRLARDRKQISLGDVLRTVRSLETADDPLMDSAGSELGNNVVRPLCRSLRDEWLKRLDAVTFEDLCLQAHKGGVASDAVRTLDYSI